MFASIHPTWDYVLFQIRRIKPCNKANAGNKYLIWLKFRVSFGDSVYLRSDDIFLLIAANLAACHAVNQIQARLLHPNRSGWKKLAPVWRQTIRSFI